MASSFPQFELLPLELQREIWQAALQVEPAGLCITFGGLPNHRPRPADVDLHCLMHVSRESRAMALKHFCYEMRRDGGGSSSSSSNDSEGVLLGASRTYRPDLDVLYIPTDRYDGFFDWRFLDSWPESEQPHHLALDGHEAQISRGGVGPQVAALVASGRLPHLKSVSLIFAAEPAPVPVYSSKRAYKLDDLAEDDYVWCALPNGPGGCRYEATDPFLIADWWKDSIVEVAGELDMRHLRVIPRRINPRRYVEPPSKGWLSSTFGLPARLRHILP